MRHNYPFVQEVMDQDLDPRLIEKGKMIEAVNMIAYEGKLQKVPSMELLGSMPSGLENIGAKIYKGYLYYFATNPSSIGRINLDTGVNTVLLQETWLNFSNNNRIININIFDDSSNGRLFLYWTDGVNPPRSIDVLLAMADNSYYSPDNSGNVAKMPPAKEPDIRMISSPNISTNNILNKSFVFSYRYIYKTGEKSALSFYSRPAFYYGQNQKPGTSSDIELVNVFNGVEITIATKSDQVFSSDRLDSIEVFAKETNSNLVQRINTIKTSIYGTYSFNFFNDGTYLVLSDKEAQKAYDNVPLLASNQELIDNILIYGDYVDGYSNDITPAITGEIRENHPLPSVFTDSDVNTTSTQDFLQPTIGPIKKGNIYHFLFFTENISDNTIKKVINVSIVPEQDYATFNDMIAVGSPDYLIVADTFKSKGINVFKYETPTEYTRFTVWPNVLPGYRFNTSVASGFYEDLSHSSMSLKPGETYKYAISYFDSYNRTGGIIESDEVSSPPLWESIGSITRVGWVEINHEPPSWAVKFKILRKELDYSYIAISPEAAETDNSQVYIKLREDASPLISDTAESIELISIGGAYNTTRAFSVPIVRVEATDVSHTLGSGRWIVIEDTGIDGFSIVEIMAGTDLYANSYFNVHILKENIDSTFKEIPGTYDIVNGYHISDGITTGLSDDTRNQTVSQSFRQYLIYDGDVIMGYYSSIGRFYYKIETGKNYSTLGRVTTSSSGFKQQQRQSSVTFSGYYVEDTGANGLSDFNLATSNYKDYDRSHGAIQKIYSKDTDLVIFQEDKVIAQPFRKNLLQTIGGQADVVKSDLILDTHRAYTGEYGMSHPETFAFRDKTLYWIDAKRGEVMRLDVNGLYPISENGMADYFHLFFNNNEDITPRGTYDPFFDEYLLYTGKTGEDRVYCYSRLKNGFRRWMEYNPDTILSDGINTYSFSGINLYRHYTGNGFNEFHQNALGGHVKFAANESYSDIKIATAVFIEGDAIDSIKIEDTKGVSATISEFEDKENFKYAGIPMGDGQKSLSIGGIGECILVSRTGTPGNIETIVRDVSVPIGMSIGDEVYSGANLIGNFTGTNQFGYIVMLGDGGIVNTGDFIHYQKNTSIEGAPLRDYIFLVTLNVDSDDLNKEIFAINLEITKSQL